MQSLQDAVGRFAATVGLVDGRSRRAAENRLALRLERVELGDLLLQGQPARVTPKGPLLERHLLRSVRRRLFLEAFGARILPCVWHQMQ